MKLVIDASVALKWFLRTTPAETDLAAAESVAATLERSETELFAPVHWRAEIIAVVARVDPALIDEALLVLEDMRATVIDGVPVLRRAAELSVALGHHLFDTLYHAVALETGATLVTADEAYFNKAKDAGAIQRLATFTL